MRPSRLAAAALAAVLLVMVSSRARAGGALCPTLKRIIAAAHHEFRGIRLGTRSWRVNVALPGLHNCRLVLANEFGPNTYLCDGVTRKRRSDAAAEMAMRARMVAACLPEWKVSGPSEQDPDEIKLQPPHNKPDPDILFLIRPIKHRGFAVRLWLEEYSMSD